MLEQFKELNLLSHVQEVGAYLYEALEKLKEEIPQVTLKVETRVSSAEQRTNKFSRTMRIDCIMLVPHSQAVVTENAFVIAPHGDGVAYSIPRM